MNMTHSISDILWNLLRTRHSLCDYAEVHLINNLRYYEMNQLVNTYFIQIIGW